MMIDGRALKKLFIAGGAAVTLFFALGTYAGWNISDLVFGQDWEHVGPGDHSGGRTRSGRSSRFLHK